MKKKDYLLRSIGFQFVFCALIFGLLFFLKVSENELYYDIDELLSEKLEKSVTADEIGEVFKSIDVFVVDDDSEKSDIIKETEASELTVTVPEDEKSDEQKPENVSVSSYTLSKRMVLPLSGRISSPFGPRIHPISGELKYHTGTDIAAPEGTPIKAAYDGEVIRADYDEVCGNFVKIKHENKIMTMYCHCSELAVREGDTVKAGQVIAFVGATGSATGPHLHFELRINDVSYDPQDALDIAINGI